MEAIDHPPPSSTPRFAATVAVDAPVSEGQIQPLLPRICVFRNRPQIDNQSICANYEDSNPSRDAYADRVCAATPRSIV